MLSRGISNYTSHLQINMSILPSMFDSIWTVFLLASRVKTWYERRWFFKSKWRESCEYNFTESRSRIAIRKNTSGLIFGFRQIMSVYLWHLVRNLLSYHSHHSPKNQWIGCFFGSGSPSDVLTPELRFPPVDQSQSVFLRPVSTRVALLTGWITSLCEASQSAVVSIVKGRWGVNQ